MLYEIFKKGSHLLHKILDVFVIDMVQNQNIIINFWRNLLIIKLTLELHYEMRTYYENIMSL